jgi:hypothetical protein
VRKQESKPRESSAAQFRRRQSSLSDERGLQLCSPKRLYCHACIATAAAPFNLWTEADENLIESRPLFCFLYEIWPQRRHVYIVTNTLTFFTAFNSFATNFLLESINLRLKQFVSMCEAQQQINPSWKKQESKGDSEMWEKVDSLNLILRSSSSSLSS